MELAKSLKNLRLKLGFESARSFHEWLQSQVQLDCNYSYYSRLESGQVIPSATLITSIGGVLDKDDSDSLTLAYCRDLFPHKKKLFISGETSGPPANPQASIPAPANVSKAKGMSPKQLHTVCATKLHYTLFLLATMARKPIFVSQFQQSLGKNPLIETALKELEEVKILRKSNEGYLPVSSEIKFPTADSAEIKKIYAQLDFWDQEIGGDLKLQTSKQKFLFRRISPRYMEMIANHCQLIIDLIRSAEELDPTHNEEVVSFSLKLMHGKVAG